MFKQFLKGTLTHYDLISKSYIYYTNKLSNNITLLPTTEKLEFIKVPFALEKKQEAKVPEIKPYDYQIEALKKFVEYYKNNDRGILSLPCGTGKTYTSFLISKNYNQIIILSPLKEFAKQNLTKYVEYGYEHNTLLVDSDGTRYLDDIINFIKSNEKFIISATFKSVDVINKCLKYLKNPLVIIDEFHNLSKNNVVPYIYDDEMNIEDDNVDNFYQILQSKNKFLFMSATPRIYELENEGEAYDTDLFGGIVYNMSFTYAISKLYITDYAIWLPSIHEDNSEIKKELEIYDIDSGIKNKCMFLFSCLLNTGSLKCIVYCKDTNEIDVFMNTMKKLDDFFVLDCEMNKITSETSHKNRTQILEKFAFGTKRQILFSVRILDECIDIPSCDSIYITYPSKSKIRTIQRISRATRINKLNPNKKANIFIWCDKYDEIIDTLSGIKEYDMEFKDKIKVNEMNFYSNPDVKKIVLNDVEKVKNYLIRIKEFKILSWTEKLEQVKKYIDENNKRPSSTDKSNDIKQMGKWIQHQTANYNFDIKKCKYGMKNKQIKLEWEYFINDGEYKKYFMSNEEAWLNMLNNVKKYIDGNNKRPSMHNKNNNIKQMGNWINTQQQTYDPDIVKCKEGMKNEKIKLEWEKFINDEKYMEYFISNKEAWLKMLNNVKKYIDKNNKRPLRNDKSNDIKQMGNWINSQQTNYKPDIKKCKQAMKDKQIKLEWENFTNDEKYKIYFVLNEEVWLSMLNEVKKYIDKNNKRPLQQDKNNEIKQMGNWINAQQSKYDPDIAKCKCVMKNEQIKLEWENFINDEKYKIYFTSNEEEWLKMLNDVKKYIDKNNKKPPYNDKNNNVKQMSTWINCQIYNYDLDITKCKQGMKNEEIKLEWENFINNEKYREYFTSNKESWLKMLNKVKIYINENNKRPSRGDKNNEIKQMGGWISNQTANYDSDIKKCKEGMKNEQIKLEWENFINDEKYKKYFISNEDMWLNMLNNVKKYIDENNKRPSIHNKNNDIKQMGTWINTQQKKYDQDITKCKYVMKNEQIKLEWENFINDEKYEKYFMLDKINYT